MDGKPIRRKPVLVVKDGDLWDICLLLEGLHSLANADKAGCIILWFKWTEALRWMSQSQAFEDAGILQD